MKKGIYYTFNRQCVIPIQRLIYVSTVNDIVYPRQFLYVELVKQFQINYLIWIQITCAIFVSEYPNLTVRLLACARYPSISLTRNTSRIECKGGG